MLKFQYSCAHADLYTGNNHLLIPTQSYQSNYISCAFSHVQLPSKQRNREMGGSEGGIQLPLDLVITCLALQGDNHKP